MVAWDRIDGCCSRAIRIPRESGDTLTIPFVLIDSQRRPLTLSRIVDASSTFDLFYYAGNTKMLTVLPLATDQYELARRRLENAEKYLTHREPGAAGYELRLLASNLKKLLGIEGVREPRRRLRR
jgi:hypothetical protein